MASKRTKGKKSGDVAGSDFQELRTLKTIIERDRGTFTPAEAFIHGLLIRYQVLDDRGRGMALYDIEAELDEFRNSFGDAIATAYFIAGRYPKPEARAVPSGRISDAESDGRAAYLEATRSPRAKR